MFYQLELCQFTTNYDVVMGRIWIWVKRKKKEEQARFVRTRNSEW